VTDQKVFRDLAAYWEQDFMKDMETLNVRINWCILCHPNSHKIT
jgi:hypothetical protein